jgi:hypothetical protein
MKLDKLIEELIRIRDECNYNAHPYGKDTDVDVWWIRDKDHSNEVFKIAEIRPNYHMGCDCYVGAEIWVQGEIEEENK